MSNAPNQAFIDRQNETIRAQQTRIDHLSVIPEVLGAKIVTLGTLAERRRVLILDLQTELREQETENTELRERLATMENGQ